MATCCPPGSTPYLEATYTSQGSVVALGPVEIYAAPSPGPTAKGLLLCPDVWGWNGGRIRAIADALAAFNTVPTDERPVLRALSRHVLRGQPASAERSQPSMRTRPDTTRSAKLPDRTCGAIGCTSIVSEALDMGHVPTHRHKHTRTRTQ